MLNKKSLALAKTLVSNESVFISVKQGSILSEAALLSNPMMVMRKPSMEDYADAVQISSEVEVAGVDFHDSAITTAVDTVGPALIRQMGYVRKTVVPFITTVTDDLLGKLKGSEPKEFIVSQYDPSALAYNPAVLDMMSKYKVKGAPFRRIKGGPEKDESEIIDSLRTGITEIDDALAEVIARDSLAVQQAYDVLFRNCAVDPLNPVSKVLSTLITMNEDSRYEMRLTDVTQVDFAIVIFFILTVYLDDPLPGTGMSLVEYQTSINEMRNQLGYLINNSLNWINNNLRSGTLVLGTKNIKGLVFTTEEATITVFGPVYRQGLAQGLTPESLIGGVIDPAGPQRLLSVQLKNKDINYKRWSRLELERAQYAQRTFMTRVATNIVTACSQALEALPDDLLPSGYNRTAAVAALSAEVNQTNKFFSRWNYTENPNLFALVKQKVCQFIFTFIDAEDIIDVIEEEMSNGDLPPAEAAYSAAVNYLAKWLVANCDICEFKLAELQGLTSSDIIE